MKKIILTIITVAAVVLSAQSTTQDNRLANAIKIKELTLKKSTLEKQIKTEDLKRNQHIDGMSYELLEQMNIRQDSLCLALRSQLVDVELALKELNKTNQNNNQ